MIPGSSPASEAAHERFPSAERLRKRPQFLHARRRGRRGEGSWVVVYVVDNDLGCNRLGVTASKKVGNAVTRNWYKRRLREIFRRHKARFGSSQDVVIIVKAREEKPRFDTLRDDVFRALDRAFNGGRRKRS